MTNNLNDLSADEFAQLVTGRINQVFTQSISMIPSLELKEAIEYTWHNGGKRLRPLLVYATGSIFNAPLENVDIAATALELIHTYSLIHDDLPCMDDADLRRGKPACHKAFGEGLAVLTGDALLTLSLQLLASYQAPIKPEKRLKMLTTLSHAAGPFGMVAGQALDIDASNSGLLSDDLLLTIYRLKTGALFSAAIELGRLASDNDDEIHRKALTEFGQCIGLAFQIQDDILDIESHSSVSGKPQNIDLKNNKSTYPHLHSVEAAKLKVEALYLEALQAINYLGNSAQRLRDLSGHMLNIK